MLKQFIRSQRDYVYDLIFPIFAMWLLPPLFIVALVGNYIIDGAIIFIVFRRSQVRIGKPQWIFLTKMWAIGLGVDFLGTLLLIFGTGGGSAAYTIWNHAYTAIFFIGVVLLCGVLIGFFNYYFVKKTFNNLHMAKVMGAAMGIITAPWTFLIPTSLFFH